MSRFNFNKTIPFRNTISAEGISVHESSLKEAEAEAAKLLEKGEKLKGLRDNNKCVTTCWHCDT
jgi:hypothetical protein